MVLVKKNTTYTPTHTEEIESTVCPQGFLKSQSKSFSQELQKEQNIIK